jgi:hypothetical protein
LAGNLPESNYVSCGRRETDGKEEIATWKKTRKKVESQRPTQEKAIQIPQSQPAGQRLSLCMIVRNEEVALPNGRMY